MKAHDFSFDGKTLSSMGFILCKFDSGGVDTIDGVKITFNTISTLNGKKHKLISTQYEDCLETTLQICKHSCATDVQEITATDYRNISKWLLRNNFFKFKILDEDHIDLYYEVAFTGMNKIEIGGRLIGLELTLVTNTPFALKEPKTAVIRNTSQNGKHFINDTSHEEGYVYPYTEIIITESGNLNIHNAMENRDTYIANCVAGEVITMDYPVITSSIPSHNIQNDFNWNFFRIANTYKSSRNNLVISIPCTIKIKYSPIIKVGM